MKKRKTIRLSTTHTNRKPGQLLHFLTLDWATHSYEGYKDVIVGTDARSKHITTNFLTKTKVTKVNLIRWLKIINIL
jgi:hypothetical protein